MSVIDEDDAEWERYVESLNDDERVEVIRLAIEDSAKAGDVEDLRQIALGLLAELILMNEAIDE